MRAIFHSSVAGWIIAGLLAIAAVLIAVDQFRFAEAIIAFASVFSTAWLWFQPYRNTRFDLTIIAVTLGLGGGLLYFTEEYRITRILEANYGWLFPANDPTPRVCGDAIARGYYIVFMPGLPVGVAEFPDIIVNVNGQDLISVDKKDQLMSISANIFGRDGRVVAIIKDNEFTLNKNNFSKKKIQTLVHW
jgi:hypothetical protein